MNALWQIHVVSHTHWDREWYLPFQQFRVRLVGLIERLLDILSTDPQYKHFMLDGQTVLLEDYLVIRPQREAELKKLVETGRLSVGPWYVMPELFLVNGEAIVRNLLYGFRDSMRFGGTMKIGYLPDAFGQVAQMPQILSGFGIDTAVIWRGLDTNSDTTEFIWHGPDGSEVLAVHLVSGYSNGYNLPKDPQQMLARIGHIRNQLQPLATTRELLLMNGGDHAEPQSELPRIIASANELIADARLIHSSLPQYVGAIRNGVDLSTLRRTQGEFRSGRHTFVLAGILSTRMWLKQRNQACETALVRWAEPFSTLAKALLPVDLRLSRSLATAKPLLDAAWRQLLQNQAHDTISGCGIDQLYHEARTRFDWSEQMAEAIATDSMAAIAENVNLTGFGDDRQDAIPVVVGVFNCSGRRCTDFVRFKAQLPADEQHDFILVDEKGASIRYQIVGQHRTDIMSNDVNRDDLQAILNIIDPRDPGEWSQEKIEALEGMVSMMAGEQGQDLMITGVDVHPTAQAKTVAIEISAAQNGHHDYGAIRHGLHEVYNLLVRGDVEFFQLRVWQRDEIEVGFIAEEVPAFGYRTYRILPGHRAMPALPVSKAASTVQNEFFAVQVNPLDGSLTVIDKETGAMFEGLNTFVDSGDAGDEYNYAPPMEDTIVKGSALPPRISLVEDGPVRFLLRVELEMHLPQQLRSDRRARTPEMVACPIVSEIALYKGVHRIDVRTEFENRALDHRLRALFPTRLKATRSFADGHFGIVERPVARTKSSSNWMEQSVGTNPQGKFVDINDGKVGLLIANRGLPEFEAYADADGTSLALTLLRSVGWLSRDDLSTRQGNAGPTLETPEAQCVGPQVFEYAVAPHAGDWTDAAAEADHYAAPLRAVAVRAKGGPLGPSFGFVAVEPETVVISTVKMAEDEQGVVVRIFNPTREAIGGTLKAGLPLEEAWEINLNEESVASIALAVDDSFSFALKPAQIRSYKLEFKN